MSTFDNAAGERIDHKFHPGARRDTLVILAHGVTGNKDRPLLVAVAEGLAQRGWPCLRISFSGNGASGGRFEDSCISKEVKDLDAVLETVPPDVRIAYLGHSMGGAVGVLKAARDSRISLLVSLAGMTHTAAFCEREFGTVTPGEGNMWDEEGCPLSQVFVDDMRAIGDILKPAAALPQPWLLIHGEADDVVPPGDSDDAFAVAREPKKLVKIPGADHSFGEEHFPRLVEEVDAWLRKHWG